MVIKKSKCQSQFPEVVSNLSRFTQVLYLLTITYKFWGTYTLQEYFHFVLLLLLLLNSL